MPVEDIVRELLLAHARPGLHKVYDLHLYEKEKAYALKLWHEKLKENRWREMWFVNHEKQAARISLNYATFDSQVAACHFLWNGIYVRQLHLELDASPFHQHQQRSMGLT